jgi:signal transduction histidine kinase
LARQQQLWIAVAGVLFLLTVATIIIIDQIRRNQKLTFQRKQQESNQEIFDLMLSQKGKLEEGKQLEQQRVSEELHDSILSQMLGIRLVLTGLNKKVDEDSITKRADLIKKLQGLEEEIRTISHELSSSSSKKIRNFIISLEDLLQNVTESSKMKCKFSYDTEVNWDQLKGDIKINTYRIVQELLQNCVKHARAKQVSINFALAESVFTITLKDDGVGFDVGKAKKGIGMKNINSRVKKMEGSWSIDSEIGQGTVTIIEIPVDNFEIQSQTTSLFRTLQSV